MPISEINKLNYKREHYWRNCSVSFCWYQYFLYDVLSLQYKIPFTTENLTLLINIMLCNFFRNTLFWGIPFRWIQVETCLSVEAVTVSVSYVGNHTGWKTTQNELFCVILFRHSQAVAISILITTLGILMAVWVCLNTLQHSDYFT